MPRADGRDQISSSPSEFVRGRWLTACGSAAARRGPRYTARRPAAKLQCASEANAQPPDRAARGAKAAGGQLQPRVRTAAGSHSAPRRPRAERQCHGSCKRRRAKQLRSSPCTGRPRPRTTSAPDFSGGALPGRKMDPAHSTVRGAREREAGSQRRRRARIDLHLPQPTPTHAQFLLDRRERVSRGGLTAWR